MEVFEQREQKENRLYCDGVAIEDIVREISPPFYVYSVESLLARYASLSSAFEGTPALVCVAMKANAQPSLLRPLFERGAGAEVVSGAELTLAQRLGCPPSRIVFSGVGKTRGEMALGVRAGIRLFLVESLGELEALSDVSGSLDSVAPVALRLNPNIDPLTHPHIATGIATAKFGFDLEDAFAACLKTRDLAGVKLVGIHSHIGSQITDLAPLRENARVLADTVMRLRDEGFAISELDVGGGWGIDYDGPSAPSVPSLTEYAGAIRESIQSMDVTLIVEPGRVLLGPVGAFIVEVLYTKRVHNRAFVIVNAGMNDFVRPALYGAHHRIVPVGGSGKGSAERFDIAGAVCESSDVFGRDRMLPPPVEGDCLAILDAGAYGFVMSSNYNLRPRPAEVVVEGGHFRLVRAAETEAQLVARELER